MADTDQNNDEYQFADLDAINPEASDETISMEEVSENQEKRMDKAGTNVKRNALIVVAIVILAMLIYKFISGYSSDKKIADKTSIPSPTTAAVKQEPVVTPPPLAELPTQPTASSQTYQNDSVVDQKLSALEVSQQSMRAEVSTVNNQLGSMTNNVSSLTAQIAQLNRMIAELSAKVESQSRVIEVLSHPKPAKVRRIVKPRTPVTRYYVQAVIPGRAWLISPNGATLTVREGTSIPGYGIVKLIDPTQGRITTSSGQVIRFDCSVA